MCAASLDGVLSQLGFINLHAQARLVGELQTAVLHNERHLEEIVFHDEKEGRLTRVVEAGVLVPGAHVSACDRTDARVALKSVHVPYPVHFAKVNDPARLSEAGTGRLDADHPGACLYLPLRVRRRGATLVAHPGNGDAGGHHLPAGDIPNRAGLLDHRDVVIHHLLHHAYGREWVVALVGVDIEHHIVAQRMTHRLHHLQVLLRLDPHFQLHRAYAVLLHHFLAFLDHLFHRIQVDAPREADSIREGAGKLVTRNPEGLSHDVVERDVHRSFCGVISRDEIELVPHLFNLEGVGPRHEGT